ncbi:hypothetical protein AGMMS49940_14250 [Spirochaetia bacterium]|nr:hypothetical protein AGMMS49940_14250 [Spirochaetia bacterium]
MSIPAQYAEIITGLLQKSQSKQVIWDVTTNDNMFVVYFENYSLTIAQHGNQNETWVNIDLINNEGDKIDSFWISDDDPEWEIARDLFSIARRSALAIDKAIQEMLTELKKDGPVGQKKKRMMDLLLMIFRFRRAIIHKFLCPP